MPIVIANSNPILHDMFENFNENTECFLIKGEKELSRKKIQKINPDFIFFPHWSFIIPEEIYEKFPCIVFHMTDLPFGRGGSPLQNLIARGYTHTKISSIKVVKELDAGPVYMKKDLCLNGTAEEIFLRAGKIIIEMIKDILQKKPEPLPQEGQPVNFKRRKPEMSNLRQVKNVEELYNYIRMLDASGYPKAFIDSDHFRFEFSRASIKSNDSIIADVRIFPK